ncbi:MAG: pyridoxal-phosphate dependent enzyme [Quinella sp. 1Q7]|nr:pyridoxal-phosphate dependent enzyme [Quinella sp. 1Q7]
MGKIYSSVTELIGNTPLLDAKNFAATVNFNGRLLVKLEYFNPAGSVKDRIACAMIEQAERDGKLKSSAVIIEPTSGNTGIGLASVAAAKGYRAIFTMPETMSVERRQLLKAYGAEIVLTAGALGMKGAIAKANELAAEIPDAFIPSQFTNPANPAAHEATTGPEIWRDTDGEVDVFVAGVGTGGTLSGVGKFLKSKNPAVKADFDVECAGYNEPIIILPDVLLERNDREIIQARLFAAAGAIAANHHKLGFIVWVAETLGGVANFPLVRQIADGLLYEWSRARKFTHDRAILSATGDLPLTLRNILYGVVPFDVLDNFQFGGEDDSFREQLERYRRNDNPAQMLGKAFSFFSDYAWLPRRYEEVLEFYRKGGVANANSI